MSALADFYHRHEKYAAVLCFAGGILYDSLTLGHIAFRVEEAGTRRLEFLSLER